MSFDFDAAVQAPHRMQPGLRRLAPVAHQLTPSAGPGCGAARHLREKLAVLGAFPDQALLCTPGFDTAPALAALAAHAAAEHPAAFQVAGPCWQAPLLGWQLDADDTPQPMAPAPAWPEVGRVLAAQPQAWRRAALLSLAFAEDFAVLDGRTGQLPWLAVALPSMWAPEEKVGLGFAAAHAPVADNRLVMNAAGQLVSLVTAAHTPDRWERFVWTLTAHPRLHAHPQRVDPARWPDALTDGDPDALAAQTWWRTERQTFLPVAGLADGARQAVFTIHVALAPLPQALATPAQAARLHAALASMSEAVLDYRGLSRARPGLLRWLQRRAEAAA